MAPEHGAEPQLQLLWLNGRFLAAQLETLALVHTQTPLTEFGVAPVQVGPQAQAAESKDLFRLVQADLIVSQLMHEQLGASKAWELFLQMVLLALVQAHAPVLVFRSGVAPEHAAPQPQVALL